MLIDNLATTATGDTRIFSARVAWEDRDHLEQVLTFETREGETFEGGISEGATRGCGTGRTRRGDAPDGDAFLSACFPLAAVHGEARLRIEGRACPMLAEGLRTAHAWWQSWGGMPAAAPQIEIRRGTCRGTDTGPRRAAAFLSGGVDGLHMLMRNRALYRPGDPAYIREALFIHGFDIGKRARDPESDHYRKALRRLEPVAAETGLRLVPCRTDLRHLPSKPGFWANRHNGAALAAVGHAALQGPAFLFIGGTYHVAAPVPVGSHAAVDGLFSSQRVTIIHDGARFSRLQKVRELAAWPTALAALRVCPVNPEDRANCGRCEKCLRTRLELLAAGIEETAAFGPSLTPIELWDEAVREPINHRAIRYDDLLPPLRARGLHALCRVLERKIEAYREGSRAARGRPAVDLYG